MADIVHDLAPRRGAPSRGQGLLLLVVGMTTTVACLTVLFTGMRRLMAVGGACASGQTPYEIATPCPKGMWTVPVSILAGIVALALYAVGMSMLKRSSWAAPAWPALFLLLGWNFWDFGINPPGDSAGTAPGWIVCVVVFALMGGLPLLGVVFSGSARRQLLWVDRPDGDGGPGQALLLYLHLVTVAGGLLVGAWFVRSVT